MSKTLCKLAKNPSRYIELLSPADEREMRHVCRKCGRMARKKKLLCKARKLNGADT